MANEVEVHERGVSSCGMPVRKAPAFAKQILSIGGAVSAAFNRSTVLVTIYTTTDCRVQFSLADGTAPTGVNGPTEPVYAGMPNDFEVVANRKIIAVAA